MIRHSFFQLCINPDEFKKVKKLKDFVAMARKQANEDGAIIPYRENTRLEDYNDDGEFIGSLKAPKYFGAAVEALSEVFFDVYGNQFKIGNYRSMDTMEDDQEDTGYDATATTTKSFKHKSDIATKNIKSGNPIFIQVKGALNPTKEFTTNDGSRIMNFYGNAQGRATQLRQRYTTRFILFTTASGLHYKLNNNTFKEIEVFNFKKISKLIDNDPFFWNEFYSRLGLQPEVINGPIDAETKIELCE